MIFPWCQKGKGFSKFFNEGLVVLCGMLSGVFSRFLGIMFGTVRCIYSFGVSWLVFRCSIVIVQ